MLFDINHSNLLFDPPPRIMTIKTKTNPWDLLNSKAHREMMCLEMGVTMEIMPNKQTWGNCKYLLY